jgi:type III secretion system FlhB-like substrate exporter
MEQKINILMMQVEIKKELYTIIQQILIFIAEMNLTE